jgi:chromosome segregation ATPase
MVTKTVTTNDLMDVMHDMMQMTSDGFERLNGRMDGLEVRMDRLETRMDGIEGRMDRIVERMDGVEGHIEGINSRLERIERDLQTIKAKLLEHDLQLADLRRLTQELTDKHSAYINDIADILDRIAALEKRTPEVTKEELYELQVMLQKLVDWAIKAAKIVKVPLKLP